MKRLKKIICLVMCFAMLLSMTSYASDSDMKEVQIDSTNEMEDVVLEVNDEHSIVVSIPAKDADEYRNKIETDSEFRKSEIESALVATKTASAENTMGISPMTLPEGTIEYQAYMYRSDIKKAVDSYSGSGTFAAIIKAASAINKYVVAKVVKSAGKKNAIYLGADLLGIAVDYARDQRLAWWKEAHQDIINRTIRAVRYTIVQNPGEYPKVWRVFERIS